RVREVVAALFGGQCRQQHLAERGGVRGLVETEIERLGAGIPRRVGDGGHDDVGVAQHRLVRGGPGLPVQGVELFPYRLVDVECLAQGVVEGAEFVTEAEPAAVTETDEITLVYERVEQVVGRGEGESSFACDGLRADAVPLACDDLQYPQGASGRADQPTRLRAAHRPTSSC